MTAAWKFLDERSMGVFSRFAWPTPAIDGAPAAWVDATDAVTCVVGVHACRVEDLSWWMSAQLWEVELDGRIVLDDRKIVGERGRLVRRIVGWEELGGSLAEWAAWRVRHHVHGLLVASGDARADALHAIDSLDDLAATAARLGTGLDSPEGVALEQIVDVVGDVPNPILCCHDAARAAGHCASAGDQTRATYHAAFAAERAEQSRWIAEQLQLG